jgi:hypothetical protein
MSTKDMFGMLHNQATATEKFLKGVLDVISDDHNTHVVQTKREASIVHTSYYCGYCKGAKLECTCLVGEILKSGEFPLERTKIEEAVTVTKGVPTEARVRRFFLDNCFNILYLYNTIYTIIFTVFHFKALLKSMTKKKKDLNSGAIDETEFDSRHNWFVGIR